MVSADAFWASTEVVRAAEAHDIGRLFRLARGYAGLSVAAAGLLAGRSASAVSRFERGQQKLDHEALISLSEGLGFPAGLLGVAFGFSQPSVTTLISTATEAEEDDVDRRHFLIGAALAPTAIWVSRVDRALIGRHAATTRESLSVQFAAMRAAYDAGNVAAAMRMLPDVIATASRDSVNASPLCQPGVRQSSADNY